MQTEQIEHSTTSSSNEEENNVIIQLKIGEWALLFKDSHYHWPDWLLNLYNLWIFEKCWKSTKFFFMLCWYEKSLTSFLKKKKKKNSGRFYKKCFSPKKNVGSFLFLIIYQQYSNSFASKTFRRYFLFVRLFPVIYYFQKNIGRLFPIIHEILRGVKP